MHIPSSTALPSTLLRFLLSSSSLASPISDRSICVRQNAPILAEAAACGGNSLQECFLAIPDFVTLDDLQSCFIEADCTLAEASSEAMIILTNCDAGVSVPELRRRTPEAIPADKTASTPTPTPTPQDSQKSPSTNTITVSGIVVAVVLALAKTAAIAREKAAEEKRKQDQEASEAALRKFAQMQVARERERRQYMEALEWAHRRAAMENPRRHNNPFADRNATAA
ncbi:hypothetical protein EKO27_g11574 [Xylaria grammica]|uniref:Extracellular membrane protein CFEM domain-containing protein n=1 Tax=Xylaria grammica TaxID=363999 RepID=A0A439CMZ3_9PEZI|nr:hypothetical protein EKO27_g11574 [Xylaria grammica]